MSNPENRPVEIEYGARGSESQKHLALKVAAIKLLRRLGAETIIVEERLASGTVVDVVGYFHDGSDVAFECGDCEEEKVTLLQETFTVVVHLPYCYTPKLTFRPQKALLDKIEDVRVLNA